MEMFVDQKVGGGSVSLIENVTDYT